MLLGRLETDTVTIQGQAVDGSRTSTTGGSHHPPVGGATVTLSVDPDATTTTNELGLFFLESSAEPIPDDQIYTIRVSASGFQPFSASDAWGSRLHHAELALTP